jgi:hypothetical protein
MSIKAVLAKLEEAIAYCHQTGVTQKNHNKYQRWAPEQDFNPDPQKYE